MADDRPAESEIEKLARVERELTDLQSTIMARVARRPTGDIEPTLRKTPKPDTLFLQGQTVSRTTYAGLWQWVQDQGLVMAGLFTSGDGSTTFGLPDFRGRVPVGVGTLGSDTYTLGQLFGEARVTLTTAEMPSHGHSVSASTNSAGSHSHGGGTGSGGSHGGHNYQTFGTAGGSQFPTSQGSGSSDGSHSHSISSDGSHSHSVNVSQSNAGGGGAHENRPPSVAINWAIWT
ncbi:tail fiber protein [Pseudonocardia hispaniensis]|uniref:Tail fiber protein n=1 Tax=Pseudonocardia hispaniensis TaxID=904933 RepID=A0ABW1J875_9PSEU